MGKILNIDIRITQRGHKDSDNTQYSDIFASRQVDGKIVAMFMNYCNHYDEKPFFVNTDGFNIFNKKEFEDYEAFVMNVMLAIQREKYGYVEVEVRGRRGIRIDHEFKISNDGSNESDVYFTSISKLLKNYFGDQSKLQQYVHPDEHDNEEKNLEQEKSEMLERQIEDLKTEMNETKSMYEGEIDEIRSSVSSNSRKRKSFLGKAKGLFRKKK